MAPMDNLFRSERLLYRAIDDTESDIAFFHSLTDDIDGMANSGDALLKPLDLKSSKDLLEYVRKKSLISVMICLPTRDSEGQLRSQGKSNATPVGWMRLSDHSLDKPQHRNAYVSVDVARTHQRKGYGTEAINWLLDWGFKMPGLHRIGIECYSFNEGAQRLYEKLGFVLEGRKRELVWFNGGWHDLISFSLLESEWRELRHNGKGANPFMV